MKSSVKPRYLLVAFLTGIAAYFIAPLLTQELAAQPGVAGALLSVAVYVCVVILLGALPVTLAWFVFRVWGRTYYRAWHINRIRSTRAMRRLLAQTEHEDSEGL